MIDIKTKFTNPSGTVKFLKGIDLHVPTGSVTVILGPSGSGKTTFLRTLNFLEKADAGTMQLNDISVDLHKASNKEILNVRRQYHPWCSSLITYSLIRLLLKTLWKAL